MERAGPDDAHRSSTRARRRRAELIALCRAGELGRAIDLAYEHLAEHGTDWLVLGALCAAADEEPDAGPHGVRLRALLAEWAGGRTGDR